MIGGVLTALITPFDEEGRVDEDALRRHTERVVSAGVDGVFACGTTGEGALLNADEKRLVIETVASVVGSAKPVIAAVIQPDTRRALLEIESYSKLPIQYVAVVTPYYVQVDHDEQVAHFLAVADASPVPVLVYDIPGNTSNPITDAIYDAVLPHRNIVGVKDSSGVFPRFARRVLAQDRGGDMRIDWINGEDTLDAFAMIAGAAGVVSGLSNVFPEPFVGMYAAVRDGRYTDALDWQHVVNVLHRMIRETGKGVAPIRLALSQAGFGSRFLHTRSMSLGSEWDAPIREIVSQTRTLIEKRSNL